MTVVQICSSFDEKNNLFILDFIAKNCPILGPEILGNHNINTGTTLLLKTIAN